MYIESTEKQGYHKGDPSGHRLLVLINLMGFDYDRFSSSGQQTYDEICTIIATVKEVKEWLLKQKQKEFFT